jgi:hypothetical protein
MTFATEPNTIICPTYGHPMISNYMQAIYIVKIVETLAVKGVRQKHGFSILSLIPLLPLLLSRPLVLGL